MNLQHLKDQELLDQTKHWVQKERRLLTHILHYLREVERRRLFVDLGYSSLFEFAVKELKYSEGQAGRRIQAMRLIKELPEVEKKIEDGHLSLSNVAQAQSYFREAAKQNTFSEPRQSGSPQKQISRIEKLRVLECLENKSAREGQKVILNLQPQMVLPKERERILTETHTEVRFVMTAELKKQLEEVRSLLGLQGAGMNLAELMAAMASLSVEALKAKKFGKSRTQPAPTPELRASQNVRYIPRAVRHSVWTRDRGKCVNCGSQRNINYDHVKPVALGGDSTAENLRLMCFQCNQRQAIKTFGLTSHSSRIRHPACAGHGTPDKLRGTQSRGSQIGLSLH